MEWSNVFLRTDAVSHKPVPALVTLTTTIAKSAIAWGTARRGKQQDPMWPEVRRLGMERRCEKDPLKRRKLSIALCRARLMRRKQTDFNLSNTVDVGAPSRFQGPPTRAPILEKLGADGIIEEVEDLDGRASIVHKHFNELFTDPRQKEVPGWVWQRMAI